VDRYDLILYAANLTTKSNQTVVRIEWKQPMGADCGHYMNDIPTVFVSLENPYHLLDFPRVKTYINCYSNNDHCLHQLVEKLTGRGSFRGKSPVDAFCGKWDTHL
jgi:beta-N-acetylhexosaminidase